MNEKAIRRAALITLRRADLQSAAAVGLVFCGQHQNLRGGADPKPADGPAGLSAIGGSA